MRVNYNPYYSPEKCGLEIFEDIDTADSYAFNMFVIWKRLEENTLWYASDSGCSCPTPFEDIYELTPITEDTMYNFNDALENHHKITPADVENIKRRVKEYMVKK